MSNKHYSVMNPRGSDILVYDRNFKALQYFLPKVTDSYR